MSFPFPHLTEKESFAYTFLNEVSFKMAFVEGAAEIPFEDMKSLFQELFNLEFLEWHHHRMLDTKLVVRSNDDILMFEFSKENIKIEIGQEEYNTFSTSLFPIINKVVNALGKIHDKCGQIELKFVDVWPLSGPNQEISPDQVESLIEGVFSPELRRLASYLDSNFNGLRCEDERFELIMSFGAFVPNDVAANSGLALETKIRLKSWPIVLNEVGQLVSQMNDVIYDSFIWAVTPEIISAMKGELN